VGIGGEIEGTGGRNVRKWVFLPQLKNTNVLPTREKEEALQTIYQHSKPAEEDGRNTLHSYLSSITLRCAGKRCSKAMSVPQQLPPDRPFTYWHDFEYTSGICKPLNSKQSPTAAEM